MTSGITWDDFLQYGKQFSQLLHCAMRSLTRVVPLAEVIAGGGVETTTTILVAVLAHSMG